jgi:predicted nucleic acid-binding protein
MYLLDANVFIQAHRRHYGFDFVPGFWHWLEIDSGTGMIASVHAVLDELTGEDALAVWAKQHRAMFRPIDSRTQTVLHEVSEWALQAYAREFADEFLARADCYLVAFAKAHGCVVVTHEQPEDPRKKRKSVKIPDACRHFAIEWADPFMMLRDQRARLVLETQI